MPKIILLFIIFTISTLSDACIWYMKQTHSAILYSISFLSLVSCWILCSFDLAWLEAYCFSLLLSVISVPHCWTCEWWKSGIWVNYFPKVLGTCSFLKMEITITGCECLDTFFEFTIIVIFHVGSWSPYLNNLLDILHVSSTEEWPQKNNA